MEPTGGLKVWKNHKNGFTVALLHYSADPDKDEAWVKSLKQNMAPDQWDQEYEIDWGIYIGRRFFQSFKAVEHVRSLNTIPGKPILRGWDFGFHYPAVVFCQVDDDDRLLILDEFHTRDIELEYFAREVLNYSADRYPNARFRDYCDPSGTQRSDKGPCTSIEILNKYHIYPTYRWVRDEQYAWGLIRQQLLRRRNGEVALLVDPRCKLIIEGFESRMRYRNFREGQKTTDAPIEEHPFIDLFDALKYLAVGNFNFRRSNANKPCEVIAADYKSSWNEDYMAM